MCHCCCWCGCCYFYNNIIIVPTLSHASCQCHCDNAKIIFLSCWNNSICVTAVDVVVICYLTTNVLLLLLMWLLLFLCQCYYCANVVTCIMPTLSWQCQCFFSCWNNSICCGCCCCCYCYTNLQRNALFRCIFFSRAGFGTKPTQKEAFKRFCLKKTRHTLF